MRGSLVDRGVATDGAERTSGELDQALMDVVALCNSLVAQLANIGELSRLRAQTLAELTWRLQLKRNLGRAITLQADMELLKITRRNLGGR